MVKPRKGLNTSMAISTKMPEKKQKTRTAITDITNEYFGRFFKEFNNSPYRGYYRKMVHSEQAEACFLLFNNISKPIKINKHIWLHTKKN